MPEDLFASSTVGIPDILAAHADLRQQVACLDTILRGVPFHVFLVDGRGDLLFLNEPARQLVGWGDRNRLPSYDEVFDRVILLKDGRRLQKVETASRRALRGEAVGVEELAVTCGDGVERRFRVWTTLTGAGDSLSILLVLEDVTEARQRELVNMALVEEMAHRSKNLLALVQTIVRQVARQPGTREDLADAILDRLQSLARAQNLLSASGRADVPLAELAASQLTHLGADGKRIALAGPAVQIRSEATQSLGMCLYELSTNAAKYGALSVP